MGKNKSIIILALACLVAAFSCIGGTKVSEAAKRLEAIAAEAEAFANAFPATMDDEQKDMWRMDGEPLAEQLDQLVRLYPFVVESADSTLALDEVALRHLSDDERADIPKLRKAIMKVNRVGMAHFRSHELQPADSTRRR